MLVIGLTGGMGSGKTLAANLFAKKGVPVIDTDQLAREVTQPLTPAYKQIVAKWGEQILQHDQNLDRKKLRKIIFSDPKKNYG